MAKNWHIYDFKTLEKKLNTDISEGLSGREANSRLEKLIKREKGSVSSLFSPKSNGRGQAFLSFVLTPSVLLLLIISLLAAIFGKVWIGGLVFAIALIGAVIGGVIKLKAQKRLEAMYDTASPMVKVRRGGNLFHTDGKNLVTGDLILLSEGDLLPCDARLVYSDKLEMDELFYVDGKLNKRRVLKDHGAEYKLDDGVKAPDAINTVYAGSAVIGGEAVAIVTDVGSETYLSEFLSCGALAGKDSEAEGVKSLKPLISKATFIAMSALLILSLLGLLTMRSYDFICVFIMLLSSASLIVYELASTCALNIFSFAIKKISRSRKGNRNVVSIRNIKALDQLCGITDLIFIGKAGLTDGVEIVRSVYTANGIKAPDDDCFEIKRILNCMFTYIKALKESGYENEFSLNGRADSLLAQIKKCGFDINGASLSIRSLYFAPDGARGQGFACAETATETYRSTLVFDKNAIDLCRAIRDGEKIRNIFDDDRESINAFEKNAEGNGRRCMYVISESNGTTVLEGVAAICEDVQSELGQAVEDIRKMGISTCVFLSQKRNEAEGLINDPKLSAVFNGKIAYADEFKKKKLSILDGIGSYCAYVGFDALELSALIVEMRRKGSRVAAYGIDNGSNEIMAKADLVISCDNVDYSSEKHRSAFYERLPASGRESNLRCSQQTRLLSKVLVHRGNAEGGGVKALLEAVRLSRGASVLLSAAILLFTLLMSTLLTFSAMSVITGKMLLAPIQAAALSFVFAILSLSIFSDQTHNPKLSEKRGESVLDPYGVLKQNLPAIISRAAVAAISSIAIRILDVLGVFGEDSDFSLPIYVCIVLTLLAEVFIVMREYIGKGESRRSAWLKVVVAYALLLIIIAITAQRPMSLEVFPHGIGGKEFFIIPAYVLMYAIAVVLTFFIEKKRKRS